MKRSSNVIGLIYQDKYEVQILTSNKCKENSEYTAILPLLENVFLLLGVLQIMFLATFNSVLRVTIEHHFTALPVTCKRSSCVRL